MLAHGIWTERYGTHEDWDNDLWYSERTASHLSWQNTRESITDSQSSVHQSPTMLVECEAKAISKILFAQRTLAISFPLVETGFSFGVSGLESAHPIADSWNDIDSVQYMCCNCLRRSR